MEDGAIRITFDNGETVVVADDEIPQVYEQLWRLAPKPGAVSTAALIRAPSTQSEFAHTAIELTAEQSAALREALEQLRAES